MLDHIIPPTDEEVGQKVDTTKNNDLDIWKHLNAVVLTLVYAILTHDILNSILLNDDSNYVEELFYLYTLMNLLITNHIKITKIWYLINSELNILNSWSLKLVAHIDHYKLDLKTP